MPDRFWAPTDKLSRHIMYFRTLFCASARWYARFKRVHCHRYEDQTGQMPQVCENIKDLVAGIHDGRSA